MKKIVRISEEHKDVTCENCGWSWDIEPDDKHPYLCHQCGHENTKGETDEGAGAYDAPSFQMEPDHVHFKHQYNEQNIKSKYLLQMERKSVILEQSRDEIELFKLASSYYKKNGKENALKVLEHIIKVLSKRDMPHRPESQEFPPSLNLQEQIIQGKNGDPYDYKKEGNVYYAKKKGSNNWIKTTGKVSDAISSKIFTNLKPKADVPYRLSQNNFDSARYQRDTFDPYAQQNIKQKRTGEMRAQDFAKGIVPMKQESFINIPPQYRIFSEFLRLRKSPVTTKDFTDKELKTMKVMIEKAKPTSVPKNVDFYKLSNFSFAKMKDGKEDYSGKDIMKNIALTIGNASVSDKGSYYQLDDIYDFNNFNAHPENYTLEKMPETVSGAFKKIFSGNLVQGVEEMAAYYQKLGYKGIPVSIQIPKNLA
jgi:hypothetical protein